MTIQYSVTVRNTSSLASRSGRNGRLSGRSAIGCSRSATGRKCRMRRSMKSAVRRGGGIDRRCVKYRSGLSERMTWHGRNVRNDASQAQVINR